MTTEQSIPTLTRMCLGKIVEVIEVESNFHPKVVKDLCKVIPSSVLITLFDILQEKGVVTDVLLLLSLVPTRTSLALPASLHIKNATLKQIGYNCPYLRCLDLSDCVQVSNPVVRIVLQGCPALCDLKLDRCHRVTDSAFDIRESPFQALVGCLSLEAISLQGCPQITGEIVTTLNKLCGSLKYLNLSQCKRILATAVKEIFEHQQIVSLNLSFLDMGCVSDDAFLSFPVIDFGNVSSTKFVGKSPLKKLNLGKSTISDISMNRMAYLSGLVEIRLQWCQEITDEGIRALTVHCPKLRLIDLKSCLITDDAVMAIARDSKDLKVLDLSWCSRLTDVSLEHLFTYKNAASTDPLMNTSSPYQGHSIVSLYLVWCSNITDRGLDCLADISSLKTVDVSGCLQITEECVDRLKARDISLTQ